MLQVGRLRVWIPVTLLDILLDLIIHYWSGIASSSNRNEYQEFPYGAKERPARGAVCVSIA
jgi:hypothetical protein